MWCIKEGYDHYPFDIDDVIEDDLIEDDMCDLNDYGEPYPKSGKKDSTLEVTWL